MHNPHLCRQSGGQMMLSIITGPALSFIFFLHMRQMRRVGVSFKHDRLLLYPFVHLWRVDGGDGGGFPWMKSLHPCLVTALLHMQPRLPSLSISHSFGGWISGGKSEWREGGRALGERGGSLTHYRHSAANCMITKIGRLEIIQSMTKPNYWQVIPCQL